MTSRRDKFSGVLGLTLAGQEGAMLAERSTGCWLLGVHLSSAKRHYLDVSQFTDNIVNENQSQLNQFLG
ncbi:hypothetical protein [Rhodoferax sp. U11-2br]|uniref:hypothetical protein n=1 Tax=Rhodoferax sp. U11-2br TaxID=2838878 RepID=UPI001BE55F90|nr:hypothetical protein [Rhodoferax sp. U11-2br]MBT3067505.1 hypothetical protein [Rhodoferax sp. U11-2br]